MSSIGPINDSKNKPHVIMVRSSKPSTARMRIFDRIINSPNGATCDDLELRLGLSHQTVSAAITTMLAEKMIVDSGERRRTRSGRTARVYLRRKKVLAHGMEK